MDTTEQIEAIKRPTIAPYDVVSSSRSQNEVLEYCNYALYHNYGPDYNHGPGLDKIVVNPLAYYDRLIEIFKSLPNASFLTMEQLAANGPNPEAVNVVIRHDVDSDVVAAMELAKIEKDHGIQTTYYILHTSFYYGHFEGKKFHRYENMAPCYKLLQDLGHEVSLHTDPFLLYQEHCMDGAQAIETEIQWLRDKGIRVPGSAFHNHCSVYGAQGYEIFKGRVRHHSTGTGAPGKMVDEDEVFFNGKWSPLHILDEKALGLKYEGHDVFLHPSYLGFIADIGQNQISAGWSIRSDAKERGLRNGIYTRDQIGAAIQQARKGEFLIVSVHPLYYGLRDQKKAPPPLAPNRSSTSTNKSNGLKTYAPNSIHSVTIGSGDKLRVSINMTNELGFLAKPLPRVPSKLISIVGDGPFLGLGLGIPEQLQDVLEKQLRKKSKSDNIHVRSFCLPKLSGSEIIQAAEFALDRTNPGILILGLSNNTDKSSRKYIRLVLERAAERSSKLVLLLEDGGTWDWLDDVGCQISLPPSEEIGWTPEDHQAIGQNLADQLIAWQLLDALSLTNIEELNHDVNKPNGVIRSLLELGKFLLRKGKSQIA